MRIALKEFLTKVIHDVVAVTANCNRKTVAVSDVVFALHRQGRTIYGFGEGGQRGDK